MNSPASLHLFCRVVDNYGDIGVCWRLARQLSTAFHFHVTLFVDELASFQRLEKSVDATAAQQRVAGIRVLRWDPVFDLQRAGPIADVVIEAFGCALPEDYIRAMAALPVQPAWINLEYLSAEAWVEGCHENRSLYPAAALTKYFFFPGFTERTGGLLLEHDLFARRDAFQSDPQAMAAFLQSLGVTRPRPSDGGPGRLLSLFCYPDAPLASWFAMLATATPTTLCLVAEGVASAAVSLFLDGAAVAGARATRGNLTVQVVPFLDQPGYDRLLWCCDMNLVRGEDSLVRAIWAGRPLLWDIYPQEEDAHLLKLQALLDIYTAGMAPALAAQTRSSWLAWSRRQAMTPHAAAFADQPGLRVRAGQWGEALSAHGSLAVRLIRFLEKNRLKYGA